MASAWTADQWNKFFEVPNSWHYDSDYEQTKYKQTLSLVPESITGKVAELACAEGHFTELLAPLVKDLVAFDISSVALGRTSERCARFRNISYQEFDFLNNPLPDSFAFELIVCSEVLYYCESFEQLRGVAKQIASRLTPKGYVLTAHANGSRDGNKSGFRWCEIDADIVIDTFKEAGMSIVRELRTPLYRIGLLQFSPDREDSNWVVEHAAAGALRRNVSCAIEWQGTQLTRNAARETIKTRRLPILMYHSVSDKVDTHALAPYRITPSAFEEQLLALRQRGYRSIHIDEWNECRRHGKPLKGNPIILTFDDAYKDFIENAFPLLEKYDFTANLFVPTFYIGRASEWDSRFGSCFDLLDADELRYLANAGIAIGSHSDTHPFLAYLPERSLLLELSRSKQTLEDLLNQEIKEFCYPFGNLSGAVLEAVQKSVYDFAYCTEKRACDLSDNQYCLPRLHVMSDLLIDKFIQCVVHATDQ